MIQEYLSIVDWKEAKESGSQKSQIRRGYRNWISLAVMRKQVIAKYLEKKDKEDKGCNTGLEEIKFNHIGFREPVKAFKQEGDINLTLPGEHLSC